MSPIRLKRSYQSMLDPRFLTLVLIIAIALIFDFINGFHDTANAIATSVATRVLSPGRAVAMAGVLNVVGALTGTAVATTVGKGIVPPEATTQLLVIASLLSAIIWDLITWWYGIPSSSSHALVFSIVGAGMAAGGLSLIQVDGVEKVLQGLVFSPMLGFGGAFLLMLGLLNLFARSAPALVSAIFGKAQLASAAYMAYAHGSNDAQKTMGVITMGLKVVQLRPIHGFAAETAAATVIEVASRLGIPISTTHTISSAILGVGATRRLSAVRWGVAGHIVLAWVFTIPACFLMAWAVRSLLKLVGA